MSKKHLEEQKLLIENFNKWINEGEKERPLAEEEEIDEIAVLPAVMATGIVVKKLGGAMMDLLKAYNDFTQITGEIASAPDSEVSPQIKGAAEAAAEAVPTLPQQIINSILQKKLGLDIDVGPISMPSLGRSAEPEEPPPESPPEPESTADEPEPGPEPEDMEARAKLGLMPKDKQNRLKQLRDKYKSEPEEGESDEQ